MKLSAIVAAAVIAAGSLGATAVAMTSVDHLSMMAHSAQVAIQASPQDSKAMQNAIAMRSASAAGAVLMKHGFTADQLHDGVIVFSHALLPRKAQPHQYYYMEIDPSPFKITVHALPSQQ